MPHESRLNNAGGYTHLLCGGGGGFSFSFLLQPINRLFGLKTNVSVIVMGFNWVDSLLNRNMGEKTERDSALDSQRYPMYKYITTQKDVRKNTKEGA